MDYGWGFFWTVIASSTGTTLLLGVVGWLCREQISHWLNKDLEAVKARHQRELEDYRTSLIAETEQTKARQALKTAGALKIIDRKYATLEALARALRDHASSAHSAVAVDALSQERRMQEVMSVQNRIASVSSLIEDAATFLEHEEYLQLLRLNTLVMDIIGPVIRQKFSVAVPPSEGDRTALFLAQAGANSFLRVKIIAMMDMN